MGSGCNFKLPIYYFTFSTFCLIPSLLLCSTLAMEEHVLDVSYPILIAEDEGGQLSKSYFGYSVSLAQGKTGQGKSSEDPDGWIFIGAPKSNASAAMYDTPSPNEPGVIWRCSLGRSEREETCELMNVDPSTPGRRQRPNSPKMESHNGAWVGVAMEVNHGRLLSCGMKWNRGRNQFYNGICYWFPDSNSTSKSSYRSNDLSKLVDRGTYEQRLMPFFREDIDQDRIFVFTNSSNDTNNGHEWQISQAGISLHLFLDEELGSSMPNLLIGAPGVREWSGAVVLYTNAKAPRPNLERPNRNRNDATFSEFVVGNRGRIPEAETYRKRNYWNEYFGYSVSSGRYLNRNKVLYAAGAPRAEHCGEVVLFDFPPYQPPTSTYKRQIEPILEIQAPKNSFASYFGSVLYSIDLDGDGLDELIVGAPMYTFSSGSGNDVDKLEKEKGSLVRDKRGTLGNQEAGDHGCVFVYRFASSEEDFSLKHEPTQFLFGSKIPRARFGSSISSLMFKHKNTNEPQETYLVIGAPYEISHSEDHSTSGAIYLYLYDLKTLRFGLFSQRIIASSISNSLNGFGSSLSIAEDIDHNITPDLAIGSFKSGHAVVLRTRPKIRLESWIKFISFEGTEIQEIRRGVPQFYLKSCFRIIEKLGLIASNLDIWVKVRFSDPSIKFLPEQVRAGPENTDNEILYMRTVTAFRLDNCMNLTVVSRHKDGIGMDDSDTLTEIKHPFHFVQEVWYNETLNRPLSVLSYSAKASTSSRLRDGRKALNFNSFEKRKPSSPKVTRTTDDLLISLTDCRDPVCRPEIGMTWSFYNENNENILSYRIGSSKEIKLIIVISNSGETAALPTLTLDWNVTDIKESHSGTRWLHRACTDYSDSKRMTYGCPLGQYIKKGRNTTIEIQFVMGDIYVKGSKNFQFNVNGRVAFADNHIEEFKSKAFINVLVPPTMVTVTGSRENDTLRTPLRYITSTKGKLTNERNEKESTLYSPIRQRFTIEVKGASVKQLTARFKIPVMQNSFENGKASQLVLVKQLHPNMNGISCKPATPRFQFHMVSSVNSLDGSLTFTDHNDEHKTSARLQSQLDSVHRRRKREDDFGNNVTITNILPTESFTEIAIDMKPLTRPPKTEKMEVESDALKLSCSDSEGSCLEVTCTLENVRVNTHVHVPFELFFVKDAIDNVLQSIGKDSLFIESTGFAYIFNAGSQHEDADVSQTALVRISAQWVEPWVYIVAGISGISILVLIILILFKCGFFKREKLQQLNNMKAEHHRKSMIAMTRASMMQARSSIAENEDGLSLERLTEMEHQNEDKEPDMEHKDEK